MKARSTCCSTSFASRTSTSTTSPSRRSRRSISPTLKASRAGCKRCRRLYLHGRGADSYQVEDAAAARSGGASEEQEDPRAELVNRLIEHEKFKSAAQMLMQKQQIEDAVRSNPCDPRIHRRRRRRAGNCRRRHRPGENFQQVLERIRTGPFCRWTKKPSPSAR